MLLRCHVIRNDRTSIPNRPFVFDLAKLAKEYIFRHTCYRKYMFVRIENTPLMRLKHKTSLPALLLLGVIRLRLPISNCYVLLVLDCRKPS